MTSIVELSDMNPNWFSLINTLFLNPHPHHPLLYFHIVAYQLFHTMSYQLDTSLVVLILNITIVFVQQDRCSPFPFLGIFDMTFNNQSTTPFLHRTPSFNTTVVSDQHVRNSTVPLDACLLRRLSLIRCRLLEALVDWHTML